MRLLAPGWYGVANVKWLDRIEVRDTRFAGHFMARDYVTIREEQRDGQPVWTETLGGQGAAQVGAGQGDPARTAPTGSSGAAWGAPVARVEVRVDGGPWMPATHRRGDGVRLRLEALVAGLARRDPGRAHHHVAGDRRGRATSSRRMDDPAIANKRTYWESNGQITRRVQVA